MSQQSEHLDTVMKRTWAVLATCLVVGVLLVLLSGCGTLFPNFTEAISPQSTEMAGLALLADFQMWVETLGGWIAFIFGS